MAEYSWPAKDKVTAIGKKVKRVDGPAKSTGKAKYTSDVNLPNMLIAKALGCPHAGCTIKSIDVATALKVPGVVHAEPMEKGQNRVVKSGDVIEFQGDLLAIVVAETEGAAAEGVKAIVVEYEPQKSFTQDSDLAAANAAGRVSKGGGKTQL